MNFEKYSNFGSIKGAMLGIILYAYLLVGISSASTFPNPCGGIRGRFICDDHDPQVFHICLGNQKYTNRCPGDLHYNVRTQNCDWPKAVNCVEEARLHASRTSGKMNMEDRNTVDVLEDSNTIDVYANEDVETIDKGSEQKVPNLAVKKPKFSYDQNPKVQNKNTVSLDVIDKYETPAEERTIEKSKEKELTLEKSKEKELTLEKSKEKELKLEKSKENDDFVVGERQSESEINLKEDITSPKTDNKNIDAKKDIELLNTSDGKEKTNESVSETTTFGVTGEPSPTKPLENDIVGHMIETYKATDSPQVFLYTRPIHRQRARRPSISPYQRSPFASPARPPVTTTRRLTTTSRPLTATTAAPPRRPVTTSRSPFKKTTVVYHPFLSNRTKPDYREYAPQLTTKKPQETRHSPSKDRSKWNPYISPAPYRSATNYDDDRANTPKWYEIGDVKKAMASKPGINSYGNSIGKSASENSLDKDRRERTPHSDIAEQVSEKPFSTTKSSTLSWVKSTTDSVIRRETSAESMERVRSIIKSRSHRARHLKTTSLETQESNTTPFAETTSKLKTKRFKSKTPLSQAWLNERKSHSEINQDYQWSKSIFKKNRWLPTEEQQTTTSDMRLR
uniref:Chitin-binding type-2 domain-containing protein n=1 Tax=Biomphalaria glabrata TaxID=6526 RepID=A0A2C9M2K5_BIOGL